MQIIQNDFVFNVYSEWTKELIHYMVNVYILWIAVSYSEKACLKHFGHGNKS